MRDGLSLLDQLRSFAGEKISPEAVAELLGQLPEDLLFEAVDLVSERDAGGMFAFADRLIRSGSDIRLFAHSLVAHLRSLFLVLHAPAAQEILDISDERLERLQAQGNHLSSEEILRLLDLANEAQLQLREGIEGRLALEVALTRMTRPDLHASPAALLSRLEKLERLVSGEAGPPSGFEAPLRSVPALPSPQVAPTEAPVEAAPPLESSFPGSAGRAPAAPAPPWEDASVSSIGPAPSSPEAKDGPAAAPPRPKQDGPVDIQKVERAWPLILEEVKRRKISFRALLLAARPVEYKGNELVLEFGPRSRFHKDQVSKRASQTPLIEAFEDILGERPTVRCVLGEESSNPQGGRRPPDDSGGPPESGPGGGAPPDSGDGGAPGPGDGGDNSSSRGERSSDPATAAIELIREKFAGAEVVDE